MPRSFVRRWYRIDLYAALERLQTFFARRDTPRASENGKPVYARPELVPLDWRNPPSESIGNVALPLAVTAAGIAVGAYFAAALAEADEMAAARAGAAVGATGARAGEYDLTPSGVGAVGLGGAGDDIPAGAIDPHPGASDAGGADRASPGEPDNVGEGDPGSSGDEIGDRFRSGKELGTGGSDSAPAGGGGGVSDPSSTAPDGGGPGAFSSLVGPGSLFSPAASITSATKPSTDLLGDPATGPGANAGTNAGTNGPGGTHPAPPLPPPGRPSLLGDLADQPVRFVANAGQWDAAVDFAVRGDGYQAAFDRTGVSVDLARQATGAAVAHDLIRLDWLGTDPATRAAGVGRLDSVSNFLLGGDASAWRTGVPEYSAVRYAETWSGVDVVYRRADGSGLEYDLVVAPGASPAGAAFRVDGAAARVDAAGRLVLTTPGGAELVQHAPVLYQTAHDGSRQFVPGGYEVRADGTVGFSVEAYDTSRELVIDPILSYSTSFGGSSTEAVTGVAADAAGNAYAVGWTQSSNFPTTGGAYDTSLGGTQDAFVTKLDAAGNVVWSTYLGGSSADDASGVALGADGTVYVAGSTSSTNFPATGGAYDTSANGGQDGFLAKLSANGTALVYATYLGGAGTDAGNGVSVDRATGQAVVVGSTTGSFPTASAFQGSYGGGDTDAFATRFNAAGSGLVFSTYLGGSAADAAYGVAIDSAGRSVAVGQTASSNFPVVNGVSISLNVGISGGDNFTIGFGDPAADAFVSWLDPLGGLAQSTYYGGTGSDGAAAVAVDARDRVYVTGGTASTDLPTVNPVQAANGGGATDSFLVRFDTLAAVPAYATYLGGTGADVGYGVAVDATSRAVVVGTNGSSLTVTRYAAAGSSIEWSTTATGTGRAAATDASGNLYAAGDASSSAVVLKYGPPAAPVITGMTDDTGASNADRVTTDTTPTLSGTAPASSTVTVYRKGPGDRDPVAAGTTTASGGGLWTYTYSPALADGIYAFTTTATVSGESSVASAPVTVTLDVTAPGVSLWVDTGGTSPTQTYDVAPPVYVRASDLGGFASPATVTLDVDLNNNGSFLDGGETGYAAAAFASGVATFDGYTALTVGNTVRFRARVTDLAGNESATDPFTVAVLSSTAGAWTATSATAADRLGHGLAFDGDLAARHALDLDRSATAAGGTDPYLVYHAQEAAPAPVVQAAVTSDNALGLPAHVYGTLTWDGAVVGTTIDYDLTRLHPGQQWLFGAAPGGSPATGRHTYTLNLFVDYTGTANDHALAVAGQTFVVNRSSSPYGAGWSFSATDALVTVAASGSYPAGVLRLFGGGGWAFYSDAGGGQYTEPSGDAGTLATVGGGGWTYTAAGGQVLAFNSSGQMTKWTSADSTEMLTYTYDGSGGVATVANPDGSVATFAYSSGHLQTVTAVGGRVTSFSYSGSDLTQVTDPSATGTHTFAYSAHRLTGETQGAAARVVAYDTTGLARTVQSGTDPVVTVSAAVGSGVGVAAAAVQGWAKGAVTDTLGRVGYTWFDAAGRQRRALAPDGAVDTDERDANGYVIRSTDPLGRVTTYARDAAGRMLGVTRPDGTSAAWLYAGANGTLTRYTDFNGGLWTYTNDAAGHRLTATDPLNHTTSYSYDTGLLKTVTDPLGNVTTYQYDASRRWTGALVGGSVMGTAGYDTAGRVVTFTDPLGNVTTAAYDAAGHVTAVTDALGKTTTATYSAAGTRLSTTDALGNITSYAYDAAGRVVAVIGAFGTGLERRTTSVYDGNGRLVASVDPLGNRTTATYDAQGRVIATVDPLGNRTTATYDLAGEVTATVDPLGRVTQYAYDLVGRLTGTTDALGNTTTAVYDANSNVLAAVDPLGHRSTAVYDAANRMTAAVDPLGNRTSYGHDNADRWLSVTDPLGNVTSIVYDARGRVSAVVDALGKRTTLGYDAADNRTSVTDPLNHITTAVYDVRNQVQATIDALGNRMTAVYDAAGQVVATVDALGNRTTAVYDALHRVSAVVDALGNRTTAVYDAADHLVAVVDALGNRTTLSYDAAGRAVAAVDALGNRTTVGYDAAGQMVSTQDTLGARTSYGYDAAGRMVTGTDALGNVWTTTYDAAGRPVAATDPNGHTTTGVYDNASRLIAAVDALGNRTTYAYDAASNLTSVTDPLNHTTTAVYDARNRVQAVVDALNHRTTAVYDDAGNMTAVVDALNRRTTVGYDAANRPVTTTDALGKVWTTTYDAASNVVSSTDPLNHTTTGVYDALNRVKAVVDPLGNRTTVGYDAAGNLTTVTDALNHLTTIGYDARNLPVATTDALGNVWTTQYDALGRAWRAIDPLGRDGRVYFDAAGQAIESTDGLGFRSQTVYDAAGNAVAFVDPKGNRTTAVYDAADQWVATVDALGNRSTTVYDAAGNATAFVDALAYRTTAVYDELNRQVAVVDPLNHRSTVSFDAIGNLVTSTDALNQTMSFGYDAIDRRVTTTDPLGFVTTSIYDAASNQTGLIDASGNRTTWVYDARDQVVTETNPLGASATYVYDAVGRLASATDRLGRRKDYAYDNADRLGTEKWYASGGGLSQTQTWTYDAAGQMLTAQDPDGIYTLAYDAAGRVSGVQELFGLVLTFGYDAVGNRTRVEDSQGATTTVTFDALNRQTSEQVGGLSVSAMRFDTAYTNRGEVSSLTRYSDLAGTSVVGTTAYLYDAAGRETNIKHSSGAGSVLANYTYTYDNADRVATKVENGTTTTYAYDLTSQLTADGAATFGYDATGNRTNAGYATGTGNRTSTDGVWTYTYDAEGNVTKKSKGASSDTWVYTYDHNDQMLTGSFSATDGGSVTQRVTYAYDAYGNRVQRQGWNGTTATTERYGVDGWDPAKGWSLGNERFDTWADLDGSNALTMRRASGTGFDEVVARQTAGGTVNWYLTDLQGSVRQVIDNSATPQATTTYSAFGQVTSGSLSDRFAYTGQEHDALTGLLSTGNGMRELGTDTGRFYQADPIWPLSDPANTYRYVSNNPTNFRDPSGFAGVTVYELPDGTFDVVGDVAVTNPNSGSSAMLEGSVDWGYAGDVTLLGPLPEGDTIGSELELSPVMPPQSFVGPVTYTAGFATEGFEPSFPTAERPGLTPEMIQAIQAGLITIRTPIGGLAGLVGNNLANLTDPSGAQPAKWSIDDVKAELNKDPEAKKILDAAIKDGVAIGAGLMKQGFGGAYNVQTKVLVINTDPKLNPDLNIATSTFLFELLRYKYSEDHLALYKKAMDNTITRDEFATEMEKLGYKIMKEHHTMAAKQVEAGNWKAATDEFKEVLGEKGNSSTFEKFLEVMKSKASGHFEKNQLKYDDLQKKK